MEEKKKFEAWKKVKDKRDQDNWLAEGLMDKKHVETKINRTLSTIAE